MLYYIISPISCAWMENLELLHQYVKLSAYIPKSKNSENAMFKRGRRIISCITAAVYTEIK